MTSENAARVFPGKVFVTGGSGHVGANLVRRLLADGDEVRCLVEPGGDRRVPGGIVIEPLKPGSSIAILGEWRQYQLVRVASGELGWIRR
jgi:nucleoside-diphosphate-sugar epimerase